METGSRRHIESLNYISIGQRIKALRSKQGLSQSALSELIDKSPTYISYIENGVKSMSLETFVFIANALDCSADELLSENIRQDRRYVSNELLVSLDGCTQYERVVILDMVSAAKSILRANSRFMK